MNNPFTEPGRFLKGNLHTHTTNSDGQLTPQEVVDMYRGADYDFLAITDHNKLTSTRELDTAGLVMLSGMELHQGRGELGQVHHIVAIGMETPIEVPVTDGLQEALTYIAPRCRFAFIAHPYWTSLSFRDILGTTGHVGVEVFNYTCHCGIGRGESSVYWDHLLAHGEQRLGFAVDDAHMHYNDSLGGWIMLKSQSAAPDAIISAIISGDFYASSGPSIEDVQVEHSRVVVRCSPCQAVNVICPAPGCGTSTHRLGPEAGPYTEVALGIDPGWSPIRIECIDLQGKKAWTNPLWRN